MLNVVTANPKIVMILHGCDFCVDWLQRSVPIYLSNVFVMQQAGEQLVFPRLSLA